MADERREDIPRMMATIMWAVPRLTIKTGFAYLRMRRDLQRSAQVFYDGMIEAGMPLEQARRLREKYESDLSTRGLVKSLGITLPGGFSGLSGK